MHVDDPRLPPGAVIAAVQRIAERVGPRGWIAHDAELLYSDGSADWRDRHAPFVQPYAAEWSPWRPHGEPIPAAFTPPDPADLPLPFPPFEHSHYPLLVDDDPWSIPQPNSFVHLRAVEDVPLPGDTIPMRTHRLMPPDTFALIPEEKVEEFEAGLEAAARRVAAVVPMSRQVIEDSPSMAVDWEHNTVTFRMEVPRPPTAEETAAYEARLAKRDAAREAFRAALAAAGGLPAALSDLHVYNEYGECQGCAHGDDAPYWPCATILLVAEHYKIDADLDVL